MAIVFPDPQQANPDGVVAVGGECTPEYLIAAYQNGIYPWPVDTKSPLVWFSPDPRGILDFKDFHLPQSFRKWFKKQNYHIIFNGNFKNVIQQCAHISRQGARSTWITPAIIQGYCQLFDQGNAYCVEVFQDSDPIGGLYGVCLGELISGESMYHLQTGASKLALYALVEQLHKNGVQWMDTQMVTPLLRSFGAKDILREDFLSKVRSANLNRNRHDLFK